MSYDASNRREVIYGPARARQIRAIALAVLFQAILLALWAIFILVKFRNNDDTGIVHVRSYLSLFVLPVTLAQVVLAGLTVRFAARRNATLRLLGTFLGGLLVFEAVSFRGMPLVGILITAAGLVLVGLSLWPDKTADEPLGGAGGTAAVD
ncbi:MAG: hypothetical protein V9F00_11895 [Nocardioides sp.]